MDLKLNSYSGTYRIAYCTVQRFKLRGNTKYDKKKYLENQISICIICLYMCHEE